MSLRPPLRIRATPPDAAAAAAAACARREPEANCSVTVVDPVLKPIVYPPTQELAVPAVAPVALEAKVA